MNYPNNETGGTVFFIKNILSDFKHVFGSRFMSNILQPHYSLTFKHEKNKNNYLTIIESGLANFPSLEVLCEEQDTWLIDNQFQKLSPSTKSLIKLISNHDFAICETQNEHVFSKGKIKLSFDINTVKPLKVKHIKSSKNDLIKGLDCFAFVIPEVSFTSLGEKKA